MAFSKEMFMEDRESEMNRKAGFQYPSGDADDLYPASQKPIAKLNLFTPSRSDIRNFQENIRLAVESGDANPLEVMAKAKIAQKYIESIVGDGDREKGIIEVKEGARLEAEKYGEKSFAFAGVNVELAELGARWDFSGCGDPEWQELQEQMKALKEAIKAREDYLKSLGEPTEYTDENTGEVVYITPPTKKSTSGLRFTLK